MERFETSATPTASEVYYGAQQTAFIWQLDEFAPEHILYSLIINPVVGKPLVDLGLSPDIVSENLVVKSSGNYAKHPSLVKPSNSSSLVIESGLQKMEAQGRTDFRGSDFFRGLLSSPHLLAFYPQVNLMTTGQWIRSNVLEHMDQAETQHQITQLEQARMQGLPLELGDYIKHLDQGQTTTLLLKKIMDLEVQIEALKRRPQ